MRRTCIGKCLVAAVCMALGVLLTAVVAAQYASASTTGGSFVSLTPTRVIDTRTNGGAVGANGSRTIALTGGNGVPGSVSAVVLNVTVTGPTAGGFVTVYPAGGTKPSTSNVNFAAGQTVANAVVTPVSSDGKVTLFNGSTGTTHLIVDIFGYYTAGSPVAAGSFGAVTPSRLLDTRANNGPPVGSNASIPVPVDGVAGIPSASVAAVILNVTATGSSSGGYLSAYADGGSLPSTSSLNFTAGQTVPNLVVAPVGSDGSVAIFNGSSGATHVIADVFGYILGPTPASAGAFGSLNPSRILDTRYGVGVSSSAAMVSNGVVRLKVTGQGGVPVSGVSAVVLNLTVTGPSAGGYLSAYPDTGGSPPTVSNLNFNAGQTLANAVIVPVGSDGIIDILNGSGGTSQIIADVSGFVLSADLPSPVTSTSRYVRNISGVSGDATTMHAEGCSDAQAHGSTANTLTLLDIGTQTIHSPLSSSNPGVVLNATTTRLSYSALVSALNGYLSGYVGCRTGSAAATIAIGTTDDGDFSVYTAAQKGADWANLVVKPVRSAVSAAGITIVGAVDIEAGFSGTYDQATAWVNAFLGGDTGQLLQTGSADGCPVASSHTSCQSIVDDNGATKTWTQAQYYTLVHALSPGRIAVLPQIYSVAQAQQWAQIDQTGASSGDRVAFVGALTENAACQSAGCSSLVAASGFAALWNALSGSALTAPPGLTVASDLRIDS